MRDSPYRAALHEFASILAWHTPLSVRYDRTYWLLGLPFDAVDMDEAVWAVQSAVRTRQRMIVVTPNVNFVSMAARDPAFRQTVLNSHLSLVDGMPLVWLGRSSGIPFKERVAGSSLLERLAEYRGAEPLRVYFLGGEPGVSALAAKRLQDLGPGLVGAGATFPGHGSIESMSTPQIIDAVNQARPDILIISLGAKKGHQWIERNHSLLEVPVISHLGAAVNFIAGTIRRAPAWIQGIGGEWLWRISQEPQLFGRYWGDGKFFAGQLLQQRRVRRTKGPSGSLRFRESPDNTGALVRWELSGCLTASTAHEMETFLRSPSIAGGPGAVIDLAGLTALDARGLGLLYEIRFRDKTGQRPALICSSAEGMSLLRLHQADCLVN